METSAKANINVENVRGHFTLYFNAAFHLITFHLCDWYLTLFAGISDACQRHQNENGYKIGIETHATSLKISLVELM